MRSRLLQHAVENMRQFFTNSEWYYFVQEDVDLRIRWVIDNVEQIGVQFKNNFVALYEWEQLCRRMHCIKAAPENMPAIAPVFLKDCALPEEVYQCGKAPTSVLLFLQDFTEPKDPDVKAVLYLCHQIDVCERKGLLAAPKQTKGILDLLKSSLIEKGETSEEPNDDLEEASDLDGDSAPEEPDNLL